MRLGLQLMLGLGLALLPGVAGSAEETKSAWKPPDPAGWIEVKSESFVLYSNAGEERTRKVAMQLELFRKALGRITRGLSLDARVPTSTFVFRNDSAFTPYRNDREGRPKNVSGYFLPSPFGNYIALDATASASPMRVVYHEYFHAVMNASLGELPLWLNEGLAEYFSTFRTRDFRRSIEVGHPIDEHLQYLALRGSLPWPDIFSTTHDSPNYNESSRQGAFYAQSWLIVHYLAATDERAKTLGRYLTLLRDGADPDEALTAALGVDSTGLAAAVEQYRNKGSGYVFWDLPEQETVVEVAVRALEPPEVWLRLGDLLAHAGPREAAIRHLEAARAAGAPPSAVESALGVAALAADDTAAGEAHLRRALTDGVASVEAPVLLANLLIERGFARAAEAGAGSPPAELLEARALLGRALERDPQSFQALLNVAKTYLFESDTTPGVAALVRARQLQPLDLELAQLHSCLLAAGGRPAEAWPLVERVIAPHSEEAGHETARCVADGAFRSARLRLEAGDRAGATAILDQAVASIDDPALRSPLVEFQQLLARGGTVHFTDSASGQDEHVKRINEAIRLANAGDLERALELLEGVTQECSGDAVCQQAAEMAAELRDHVASNDRIKRYNEAVELANAGKRKEAIAILRALEPEIEDPEWLEQVRTLLRQLGAKAAPQTQP